LRSMSKLETDPHNYVESMGECTSPTIQLHRAVAELKCKGKLEMVATQIQMVFD
jgi:hypothetical protein